VVSLTGREALNELGSAAAGTGSDNGNGTWDKILGRLRAGCDEAEGKDWTVSADSTVVRAHQHAAGARHAPPAELAKGGTTE
jgi:hypothetical protein